MSKTAWTVLAATTAFTCGVIYYVHNSQKLDRERLREGVLIDIDKQRRKIQNIHQLELQADLIKLLQRQQAEQDERDRLSKVEHHRS